MAIYITQENTEVVLNHLDMIRELVKLENVDMGEGSNKFIADYKEKLAKWGDGTYISEKQGKWVEGLFKQYCGTPAPEPPIEDTPF